MLCDVQVLGSIFDNRLLLGSGTKRRLLAVSLSTPVIAGVPLSSFLSALPELVPLCPLKHDGSKKVPLLSSTGSLL